MKRNILIWGAAVLLVLLAVYITGTKKLGGDTASSALNSQAAADGSRSDPATPGLSDATVTSAASSGEKATDFTLTDLNGDSVSLQAYRGKTVYVNFWATWCTWCKKEMPDIEKVYQDYKDKNVVVLAVNVGEDADTVRQFLNQNPYDFSVLLDSDGSVSDQYVSSGIPVSLFIDKNGDIVQKRIGALSEDQMTSILDGILLGNS